MIYRYRYEAEEVNRRKPKVSSIETIDILKQRYAKGEITDKEYQKIKKDLE